MPSKKKTERVSVELDKELLRAVSAEMARMRKSAAGRPTKAGAVRAILRRASIGYATKATRERIYEEILRESKIVKDEARELAQQGRPARAHKMFLQAAIMELEALQLLDDPSEDDMKTALIEVVGSLKDATGYRHLPDVPRPKRVFEGPVV